MRENQQTMTTGLYCTIHGHVDKEDFQDKIIAREIVSKDFREKSWQEKSLPTRNFQKKSLQQKSTAEIFKKNNFNNR